VWRHPLADVAARAPRDRLPRSTFLALVTARFGQADLGHLLVWDARLTPVLILFLSISA